MEVANLEELMKSAKRKIDLFGTDNFRSWMLYFVPGDGTDSITTPIRRLFSSLPAAVW